MEAIGKDDLQLLVSQIRGKHVDVEERGIVPGAVSRIEIDDHGFVIFYVINESLEEGRFGGSWKHGFVWKDGRELHFSVQHIGSAIITL